MAFGSVTESNSTADTLLYFTMLAWDQGSIEI